ncbi:twin-arginine translocation signal domain-containing protein [Kitasatospora sp. NPDC002040]|uniref:twin-arginine translocation signal domain-containing protein n=1 Tax=Kitasatospora sp. NPDC002040 TaxID=3154661 RepID=UPI003326C732
MTLQISRRGVLRGATVVAAGAGLGPQLLAAPGYAAAPEPGPAAPARAGAPSKNGWPTEHSADSRGHVYTRPVPGTPVQVQVRIGEVETVLVHVVRRFHYEIDALRAGDVVGWRPPGSVRRELAESNLASGTAVRIRPGSYPAGARGGFYPLELLTIRAVLAECDGVVRWGGDDRVPDESLFHLDVAPDSPRLARLVEQLRAREAAPGQGAGVLV